LLKRLWKLYALFFKLGLFTFGGGLAMLPLLKAEIVDKRRFLTEEELMDLYSIGQCTPGIIVVNVVTFIGYQQMGIKGAIASTLGAVTPSVIIITLLATLLQQFIDNIYVVHAFSGIRLCVLALIASMVYDMGKKNLITIQNVLFFMSALGLLIGLHFSAAVVVITAVIAALCLGEIQRKLKK